MCRDQKNIYYQLNVIHIYIPIYIYIYIYRYIYIYIYIDIYISIFEGVAKTLDCKRKLEVLNQEVWGFCFNANTTGRRNGFENLILLPHHYMCIAVRKYHQNSKLLQIIFFTHCYVHNLMCIITIIA